MQRLLIHLHDQHEPSLRYSVLVPSKSVETWQHHLPNFTIVAADQKQYSFQEQLSLLFLLIRLHPNLTHFTMPQQPVLWFGRSVTTIHDNILIHYENIDDINPFVYRVRKLIFTNLVRLVIWRSRYIISPTEYVRQDLIRFSRGSYAHKIIVTPEAGDTVDEDPEPIAPLENTRFLFFVGNAFPYKNVRRIILAFQKLKNSYPDLQLALAGKKEFFYEQLEEFTKKEHIDDVHFLGFISDGQKKWAFQHAVSFVTASLEEGFCIPLAEAMVEGCPVISSNASCLPEVAGDGAIYFDPHSTDELVARISEVLDSESLRNSLIARGKKHVKKFSWKRMARQTRDTYKDSLR